MCGGRRKKMKKEEAKKIVEAYNRYYGVQPEFEPYEENFFYHRDVKSMSLDEAMNNVIQIGTKGKYEVFGFRRGHFSTIFWIVKEDDDINIIKIKGFYHY